MLVLDVEVGISLVFVNLGEFKVRNWDLLKYAAISFAILLVLNLLVINSAFQRGYLGLWAVNRFLLLQRSYFCS